MTILIDYREKKKSGIIGFCVRNNIPFKIVTLKNADYSFIGFDGNDYRDRIVIEKKSGKHYSGGGLSEIKGNLFDLATNDKGQTRLIQEFERIKAVGAECFLILENTKSLDEYSNVTCFIGQKRRFISNSAFKVKLDRFISAYLDEKHIIFCSEKDTGKEIIRIFNDYLTRKKQ
jgi:hypothetical protein